MILLALLSCGEGPAGRARDAATDEVVPLEARIAAFRERAEAEGYTVQEGRFDYLTLDWCCDPGASCLFNNPDSPYALYALPPAPDQVAADSEGQGDGTAWVWRLRPDEAVVLLGNTPPSSAYFSYRSYLSATWDAALGLHDPVLGSLGPSLNHAVIAEQRASDLVHGVPLAVVTSADAAVEGEVHALLEAAGFDGAEVHDDRIPAELVTLGVESEVDTFMAVARVAILDELERDPHLADPGMTLLRLSPTTPRTVSAPHPVPDLLPRGTGAGEEHLAEALDALEDAVREAYGSAEAFEAEVEWSFPPTLECIETGYCAADLRDRLYGVTPEFRLQDDTQLAVVVGVNHEATGKATYANFAVDAIGREMGLLAVNSTQMAGSARAFLADHPSVDRLYAYVVARDCTLHPGTSCVEVPYGCPGAEEGEWIRVSFRAYLEPATGAAPLPEELLADRVLRFVPQ